MIVLDGGSGEKRYPAKETAAKVPPSTRPITELDYLGNDRTL